MPSGNIRKSKKTGGRKSGVPMPVVIGVGLLALAAALLLVTRTDLGRQLMTAVPSGSPSPTPSGIVWGCKTPAQNGCKCTYSIPQESAAPIKTAYLPAYFKLCSSKLGGSWLSSDATSVSGKVCIDDCSTYIKSLGYKEESPGRPAGAVSAGMCYKVGGSSPVSCRAGARWGDPEPFTWDQCKIQCRCLYKKGTSTQVLPVPSTPTSLEGSFCSASGHPPESMLDKFVGDCPASCEAATPIDWQYVRLAEPAYLGTCRQTVQCDPTTMYPQVGFTGDNIKLREVLERETMNIRMGVFDDKGELIAAPYDIKVLLSTRTGVGQYAAATPGQDFTALNKKEVIIEQGTEQVVLIGGSYDLLLDDDIEEEDEQFFIDLEIAPGEKAKIKEGQGTLLVVIKDDDGPPASPSATP